MTESITTIGGTYSISIEDSETPSVVFEFNGFLCPSEALAFIEVMQENISAWFTETNGTGVLH